MGPFAVCSATYSPGGGGASHRQLRSEDTKACVWRWSSHVKAWMGCHGPALRPFRVTKCCYSDMVCPLSSAEHSEGEERPRHQELWSSQQAQPSLFVFCFGGGVYRPSNIQGLLLFCAQRSCLVGLKGPYMMPRIESKLAVCKARALIPLYEFSDRTPLYS